MKISGFKSKSIAGAKRSRSSSKASEAKIESMGETSRGTPSAIDSVEVGDHLATIDLIKNLVAGTPDLRMDQVERIVHELKSGKYKINFEKVAEGFIKETIITEIARKPKNKKN